MDIQYEFVPPRSGVLTVYSKGFKAHVYTIFVDRRDIEVKAVHIEYFDGTELLIIGRKVHILTISR